MELAVFANSAFRKFSVSPSHPSACSIYYWPRALSPLAAAASEFPSPARLASFKKRPRAHHAAACICHSRIQLQQEVYFVKSGGCCLLAALISFRILICPQQAQLIHAALQVGERLMLLLSGFCFVCCSLSMPVSLAGTPSGRLGGNQALLPARWRTAAKLCGLLRAALARVARTEKVKTRQGLYNIGTST